jgi:acetoin utilization protein AcuB
VAHPETLIREIVRVMFRERVGAMPIVNDTGRLKGIITRSDILRALMRHTALELYI